VAAAQCATVVEHLTLVQPRPEATQVRQGAQRPSQAVAAWPLPMQRDLIVRRSPVRSVWRAVPTLRAAGPSAMFARLLRYVRRGERGRRQQGDTLSQINRRRHAREVVIMMLARSGPRSDRGSALRG
jgi:hypothetical protein